LQTVEQQATVFSLFAGQPGKGFEPVETSAVHDRMPVILDPVGYDLWLDPGMKNVTPLSELLKPFDARLMRCYPVSSRVNSVANDDEACSAPLEPSQIQDRLFS
jgi:putative SOS response-associated peptidase YedK